MKKISLFLTIIAIVFSGSAVAQTISVEGQCIDGTIILDPIEDVDGKPAFEGTGTVQGIANTPINIYWIPSPDNVWVLAFDGQPYFQNPCPTGLPPGTANTTCLWVAVNGTVCTGATPLSVTGTVALPVSLLSFTANKNGKNIILRWKTSGEINNRGFEIQKSHDGSYWTNIGFIEGHPLSAVERNYAFTDSDPYKGRNAYRLRQVDLDGNQSYSPVENIDFQSNYFYSISGNPGKGVYKINMPAGSEKLYINVIDATGKIVFKKITGTANQLLDISIHPSGIYWLQLKKGNQLFTEKTGKVMNENLLVQPLRTW